MVDFAFNIDLTPHPSAFWQTIEYGVEFNVR